MVTCRVMLQSEKHDRERGLEAMREQLQSLMEQHQEVSSQVRSSTLIVRLDAIPSADPCALNLCRPITCRVRWLGCRRSGMRHESPLAPPAPKPRYTLPKPLSSQPMDRPAHAPSCVQWTTNWSEAGGARVAGGTGGGACGQRPAQRRTTAAGTRGRQGAGTRFNSLSADFNHTHPPHA